MALQRAYGASPNDFGLEVSRGNVPGMASVNVFGANLEIDTATVPEDIWDFGGPWPQPTAAQIFDLASTDPTDNGVLSLAGAWAVRLFGLKTWNDKETFEDIITNGITLVPTVNSYVMINRLVVISAGTDEQNNGDITAVGQIDGNVVAQISAQIGQSLMAILGIPTVQTYYATEYYVNWSRNGQGANEARMLVAIKNRADQADALFVAAHATSLFGQGSTFINVPFDPPALVAAAGPAIVKVRCTFVDVNATEIFAGFNGYLVDNG